MKSLAKYDEALFQRIYSLTASSNCLWVKWLSKTGDGYLYLALGIILWWLEPKNGALFLYTGLLAYTLEIPVYLFLKNSLKRQRPCNQLVNFQAHIRPSDKFSLPSGHTAAAFLMASLIANFYPTLGSPAYLWASCIGFSRVLLGVHYPSDILAGALLGVSISVLSLLIL